MARASTTMMSSHVHVVFPTSRPSAFLPPACMPGSTHPPSTLSSTTCPPLHPRLSQRRRPRQNASHLRSSAEEAWTPTAKPKLQQRAPAFILWGPPGSGKSSLCEVLSHTHGLVHISTGALLRAHVLFETQLGKRAARFVLSASPVPDDIVIPMVLERLRQPDCRERGFVLDGFPRNPQQQGALAAEGLSYQLAIMLHAPRETLARRIRYRRLDPETDVLYNLRLRPPTSQEVLERLIVLDKDHAANAAELFASYGRATADTFDMLTSDAVRIDADRPFDNVLLELIDVLEQYGVPRAPGSVVPQPLTTPLAAAPPDEIGRPKAVLDVQAEPERDVRPARAAAALRGRRENPSVRTSPFSDKSPITLIRCDGYMCERESVEESHIVFRGAATEQVMLVWNRRPQRVLLLVKKDPELMGSVLEAARFLMDLKLRVVVENRVQTHALANGMYLETFSSSENLNEQVDFVVCLGGDGLILHVSTLFRTAVPPVISFNLGSLGFLTPFQFKDFSSEIANTIRGNCNLSLRMRLTCQIIRDGEVSSDFQVLNEVVVDRGASPYLSNLDCFCDGKYITTVQADGIIMSTPTGSTAYSMSAGGSMVHPSVQAILFTPICPHSLSFRPIVFPDSAVLRIEISDDSRSVAWASFDGKSRQQLRRGDGLVVQMNMFPVPTVNKTDHTGDWFQSLDRAFNFNSRAGQKPLSRPPLRKPPASTGNDWFGEDDASVAEATGNGKVDRLQSNGSTLDDGVEQEMSS